MAAASGERWSELSVDTDIELEREYGERLPVVLLDGKEHGYFQVEEDRLLRDLARRHAEHDRWHRPTGEKVTSVSASTGRIVSG